jgi:translation initiation factor 1
MSRRTVYSTDQGRHCPNCGAPVDSCQCNQAKIIAGDGIVRLQRQTKGRNGKPVTLITGVPLAGNDLKGLAKELKNKCGVGGSIEDTNILIQGDKRDLLKDLLEKKGYTVKISGG